MERSEKRPRVTGVVLAYHPEHDIVDNVRALARQTHHVVVVDNSPDDEVGRAVLAEFAQDDAVTVIEPGGNVGVAAGFNAGMRAAFAGGADFVWIFDQDSTVTDGMIDRLLAAHRDAGGTAGVIGPALRSQATGVVYRRESGDGMREVDVLISSGSLFSRALVDAIGLHDEPLFIDYVDHDICLRARRYGYRNIKVFDAVLDHRFGDSAATTLFGRRIFLSNYSPLRHYYAARNRTIVLKRFGAGRWFWEDLGFTTKAWIKVLLREENRRTKVAAFLRGVRDGVVYPTR
ncbi:glycosyltransferase family 2 protein [Microbacterium cremeum]|uniref:glycosyltransferase family 2 protein n=1 Tax=Microbacterium cremeum TaxID=2782169 RepID=UPI0018889A0D|nr:glycosyltransferase family 2 protein [Microbacterium cremeum]